SCKANGSRETFLYNEVLDIIAKSDGKQKMNVIVCGDNDFMLGPFDKPANQPLVEQALNEQHAKTPIAWIITGGDRPFETLAWKWARENKVDVYRYLPKWKKHGRFAGFKVGPQMLRSMFDPKMLLVFLSSNASQSSLDMIRRANKAGIPVMIKQ